MKTLTFNQKALKEPINMCMETLPRFQSLRQAQQQVTSPVTPGSGTASLTPSFQHNHIGEI